MASLPLPRSELPGLAPLFNGELWERWAGEGKVFPVKRLYRAVRYIRLKPATSCRLAVFSNAETSTTNGPPIAMLVYLFPNEDRAQEFFVKRTSGKTWGKAADHVPFVDRRRAIVALPFPNDREIPGLRHVYRHYRLKETLLGFEPEFCPPGWKISKRDTELQLVRYKTGRRAVLKYTPVAREIATGERRRRTLHLKVEAPEFFSARREAVLRELTDELAPSGIRIPRALGTDEDRFLTLRPWYPGVDLSRRKTDLWSFEAAAHALAALHAAGGKLSVPAVEDPVRTAIDAADALEALLPEDAARIRRTGLRIAECLEQLATKDPVLLHGDFHPAQVLFHEGETTVIDLDRLGTGHPVLDLGSFLAHAVELGAGTEQRQAFIDAYCTVARNTIAPADLTAGYCLGLLRRCNRPFRDLLLNWPQLVRERIDRVERKLEELG